MQNKASQKLESQNDLYSTCPAGEVFPIPKQSDDEAEFARLSKIVGSSGAWGVRS